LKELAMKNILRVNKILKLVAVSAFLSAFALVGTVSAGDCVVPKATANVGDASVGADEFEAIKSGIGSWGAAEGRTYASAAHSRSVGLSEVAAADFDAVRDIVSGKASMASASDSPRRDKAVNVGLVEVDQNVFDGVQAGLGKAPVRKAGNCA
jgi:hypothetical protein